MENEDKREFYVVAVGQRNATIFPDPSEPGAVADNRGKFGFGKFETQYQLNSDEFNAALNSFAAQLLGDGVHLVSVDLF